MCELLKVSRSNYYTYQEKIKKEDPITKHIKRIFRDNNNSYGTRRIQVELRKEGYIASRRRIGRIMREKGLVSVYTVAQYRVYPKAHNTQDIKNELDRSFDNKKKLEAIVSDLTYVRVGGKWNYICTILDLFNREIIGYSAGPNKDANLILKAFSSIKGNLNDIGLFHTDRGKEFINKEIERLLSEFGIKRSLSNPGVPYDNSVAESNFKSLKFEFVYQNQFENLEELKRKLGGHIWWYNNKRLHSSLGYKTPIEYKMIHS